MTDKSQTTDYFLLQNVQASPLNLFESDPGSRRLLQKSPIHSRLQYTHTELNGNLKK